LKLYSVCITAITFAYTSIMKFIVYSCRRTWKVIDVASAKRDISTCRNRTHRAV